MMLRNSNESLDAFSRELEFRATLFRKPLDAVQLAKLGPSDVFRAARGEPGADSELIKEYISSLAVRKLRINDGVQADVPFHILTEDGVEFLADAQWNDCWQTTHGAGRHNSVGKHSKPVERNSSQDSLTSHHSHPYHYPYGGSASRFAQSGRPSDDCTPAVVRICVDFLTGAKGLTADINPLATVLDLKQRIKAREKIPPRDQLLFFGRERMLDQRTLHSYNIREGSRVVLSPTVIAGTH